MSVKHLSFTLVYRISIAGYEAVERKVTFYYWRSKQ